MFTFLTAPGILSTNHVFYEQVHSFCSSALGLVDEQLQPNLYPALTRFHSAIQFDCKPVVSYLLSGRGKHGSSRNHHQTPQEYVDTHNLSFLHPRSVTRNSPPGHLKSGIVKEDVELSIEMFMEKECLSIQNERVRGYLCSISTDEMALKPALEYSPTYRSIIGLVEPEQLKYEDVIAVSSQEDAEILTFLKERQFVTQAREVRVASLDNKVDFPIGVFYCGNKGGAQYIEQLHHKISDVVQRCSSCLKTGVECTFHCEECFGEKFVCESCASSGYTEWHPLLRPCSLCTREDKVCTRLFQLVWATDCDPKQKSFTNSVLADRAKYPYQVPIPDCPHNIKSVRSAEFWHWIGIDGYLVNVRLLLVLRREYEDIKNSVSWKALRNKDRMDVETAVEIHRKAIQDSIPDERVSTTLVPELEKHWKKNGASLLNYPIGLAFSPKHSRLFITDRLHHAVFMVDMHCPANVTLIAGGGEPGHTNGHGNKARFRNPAGIAVKESGKLYVCDQGNGRVRVVNLRTLFCHASQIVQGDAEES